MKFWSISVIFYALGFQCFTQNLKGTMFIAAVCKDGIVIGADTRTVATNVYSGELDPGIPGDVDPLL